MVGTHDEGPSRLDNKEPMVMQGNAPLTLNEARTEASLHQDLACKLLELRRELNEIRKENRSLCPQSGSGTPNNLANPININRPEHNQREPN